jgi:predicted SAM-dependent methyltransferase
MQELKEFLEDQGYFNICEKNGRLCAMFRFAYSMAIVADIDEYGYDNRWCYQEYSEAYGALLEWDGIGEPQNWHRHLPSMRRRNDNNEDIGSW